MTNCLEKMNLGKPRGDLFRFMTADPQIVSVVQNRLHTSKHIVDNPYLQCDEFYWLPFMVFG